MTSPTPETANFGFTRINAGEAFSKNGWAFSDADRIRIDDLFQAALTHKHTGEPALGDPTDPPTFVAVATGGHLAPATSYFYRCSFVDQYGLESAASAEGSVTTPDPVAAPSAPAATVESTSGTVIPGIYSYLITYLDAYGGETTPSSVNNVQVITGTTNRIRLDLPALITGTVSYNVYRSRPGQSQFYYLGNSTAAVFYDTGTIEDQTIVVPTVNSTNSANSIQVTIPAAFIPEGCVAWRIYRATDSGGYDGNSLVHEVIEGVTDSSTVPRTMWVDTGDTLLAGFPSNTSSTVPQGSILSLNDLGGTLPIAVLPRGGRILTVTAPGVLTNGQTLDITESPTDIKPVRLTAFFKTPPGTGEVVKIHIQGSAATPTYVELTCDPSITTTDPAGYFHAEWPLSESLLVYAQDGTVSDPTAVPIITDDVSPSGQSVVLDTNGEWVQTPLGPLDVGTYAVFVSMRSNGTSVTGDIRVDVLDLDNSLAVLHTYTTTVANFSGNADVVAGSFTAPGGGHHIAVRVTKITTTAATYEVVSMRYTTTVPLIAAGVLTVTAVVTGTATAADANIALWF